MDNKDLLRTRRRELGLTQAEVAKAVGVSEATVSRWESGNIAEVGSGKIPALAEVLQMDASQLLQGKDDELAAYLEILRTRPEMRSFFSLAKNASKQDVEDAMRIVEAYFAGRPPHSGGEET